MPPHIRIPARAAAVTGAARQRGGSALARAALTLSVLTVAAAGTVAAGAGPAAAAPAMLYAAAAGTGDCSTAADACDLATALGDVAPGGTIELVTPGATAHYVGNWTVATTGTSATAPVTIEAAPGLASQPVLDGNNGATNSNCTTSSCEGPVLTVPDSTEFVALSGITITNANNTLPAVGHGGGGGLGNAGTVTITGSTFSGNTAIWGGAIDTGDHFGGLGGTGSVTVTASTFTDNSAGFDGGAINSGDGGGGSGTVTVTASTFTGNTARTGGAIDSGQNGGSGTVTVTASTFTGNTAPEGNTIFSDGSGSGTAAVAGDVFDGSCAYAAGTWTDGGYNAGIDSSCYGTPPPSTDLSPPPSSLGLGSPASNGGPTQTIEPLAGSPVIGMIPNSPVSASPAVSCPATDQRGYYASGSKCDAGAVQTSGSPPALALKDSAAPASFYAAGQQITYSYQVANTGTGTLSGISVTDPAVPGVSCPAATLSPGTSETCTGTYTTTAADLAAGTITGTATAAAATANGVPVTSPTATVTVPKGWPPVVTGVFRPAAGAAEGYYLGVTGNTWSVFVTHPGTAKVAFTGHVSVPAGTLGHLSVINPTAGHQLSTTGKVITFTLPDYGKVTGFSFTTTAKVSSISLTLDIGGHPATASQINLGGTPTNPGSGSPLTYTR